MDYPRKYTLKGKMPKDFRSSLVLLVGWSKSKLTLIPLKLKRSPLWQKCENCLIVDFGSLKEAHWCTERDAKNQSFLLCTISDNFTSNCQKLHLKKKTFFGHFGGYSWFISYTVHCKELCFFWLILS